MSSRGVFRLAHAEAKAGVPPYTYATLVLPIAFSSSSTTGSQWYWQFRLNSLYDPDFTGSGSQPTTFDQWMALYDRYRVLGVDVELTLRNLTNSVCGIYAAMAPGVDSAPTLTYYGIGGMRGAVFAKQLPATTGFCSLRKTFLMKDVFGINEEAMMSELNLTGTSSTSAPQVAYLSIGAQTTGATDPVYIAGFMRFAVRFEQARSNNVSLATLAANPLVAGGVTSPSTFTSMPPPILTEAEARLLQAYRTAPPRQ